MRFVVVAGSTATARIEGISAAGAEPAATVHTPSADCEMVAYGRPVRSPVVPISPSGCPTPAVVTRAVHELAGFETVTIDAGLARSTAAPTVEVGGEPGQDVRTGQAVPGARDVFAAAEAYARGLPDDDLVIGETIPGGTTTARCVLAALGEREATSSSLAENPLALKRRVVDQALDAAGIARDGAAGAPLEAGRAVGDPVLAAVAGLVAGATATDTAVTLAGGTQLCAAAALARHAGVDAPLSLATTSFLAADRTADVEGLASDLDLDLTITDPGFDRRSHPALDAYVAGEAKEGVGMGGALALAERQGIPMADVRDRVVAIHDRLLATEPRVEP
ncbi:nicotinate mononucleotide-dependent phosphoribosyltransferase CobT [Halococcus agarilyticus]|uniref:nicotinate mononucleotide-dependent phosphoribosyltransferase CobT n=1 Tax=Halococcus agarilyticus TaxID=1232219 RepID=UPI000677759C|nr:TIGR00303 family protein [Halococcus agarilyticus]